MPNPPPEQVIAEVLAHTGDATKGAWIFRGWCMFCHGDQVSGTPPMDFDLGTENPRRFRGYRDLSRADHVKVVVRGYVSKQSGHQNMPAFALRLTRQQIADVVAYEQGVMEITGPYDADGTRRWMEPDYR